VQMSANEEEAKTATEQQDDEEDDNFSVESTVSAITD